MMLEQGVEAAGRAREWRKAALSMSCDVARPWEHGTVFRAGRYPSYYDLNVVLVEEPPAMRAGELVALEGLSHRLIEFVDAADAEPLRPAFERRGWRTTRLVWMRRAAEFQPTASDSRIQAHEVPYDAVRDLRVRWYHEDFPGIDPAAFHRQSREVALRRRARVFAVLEDGETIAFAQLEHHGEDAEISEVYVRRDRRGRGVGTAITKAAVAAGREACDLWIVADDEDRPKHLYHRLGFRATTKFMQFLRLPG
jgi:GNAT superfamily N-acetyltransferase